MYHCYTVLYLVKELSLRRTVSVHAFFPGSLGPLYIATHAKKTTKKTPRAWQSVSQLLEVAQLLARGNVTLKMQLHLNLQFCFIVQAHSILWRMDSVVFPPLLFVNLKLHWPNQPHAAKHRLQTKQSWQAPPHLLRLLYVSWQKKNKKKTNMVIKGGSKYQSNLVFWTMSNELLNSSSLFSSG